MSHKTGMTDAAATAEDHQPPSANAAPLLLLLGDDAAFESMLASLGKMLGFEVMRVHSVAVLETVLHARRPIGLACSLSGTGVTAACHALKATCCYDACLPMLLVTDADPETLGGVDAIAALCGLADLQRLIAPPRTEDVLAFLARAGRRSGVLALLPV